MITYAPLVGRILMGLLFLIAGIGKFMDITGTSGYIASAGLPYPLILAIIAASIEVGAGSLLILGFKTRYAAGILALFALVVNLIFHSLVGPQQVVFLKDLAIMGGLLGLYLNGAGPVSMDFRREKRLEEPSRVEGRGVRPAA